MKASWTVKILNRMIRSKKANGVLGQLLAKIDKTELEKTSNRMLVAAKIGNALKQKKITQKEFAKIMSRSESEISEWLSGDRNFTIDTLTEISTALNISLLDTSLSSACIIPMYNMITAEKRLKKSEIVESATWMCPFGDVKYISNNKEII
jgi:transcriptional regulator with XRE-family HTH domain